MKRGNKPRPMDMSDYAKKYRSKSAILPKNSLDESSPIPQEKPAEILNCCLCQKDLLPKDSVKLLCGDNAHAECLLEKNANFDKYLNCRKCHTKISQFDRCKALKSN